MSKNLPIETLRSFVTVADFGSITQAGELLARSQPAISMQIKRLEKLVETPLFHRREHKLKLTDDGEQLFRYAREILHLNDEALATFNRPPISGNIRFGIPSEFATTLLPKIVCRFSQNYPTVSLDVSCDLSVNLLAEKNRSRFDLILALQDRYSGATSRGGWKEELVWVSNDKHRPHEQVPLPLIVAPEGCIYRRRAIEKLDGNGRAWRIVYTNPDLGGIKAAIEEGLGVTVLARSTVPENLHIIKPGKGFPLLGKVAVQLIKNNKGPDEAVVRLMEYIRISLNQVNR